MMFDPFHHFSLFLSSIIIWTHVPRLLATILTCFSRHYDEVTAWPFKYPAAISKPNFSNCAAFLADVLADAIPAVPEQRMHRSPVQTVTG